jgi:Ca2+-binding EF-hand superfamily protein
MAEGVNENMIAEMDEDGGGSVDKYEFLSYMLLHTGKVSKHEIQSITQLFSSLDKDGSGSLDKDDIRAAMVSPDKSDPGTPSKRKANYEAKETPSRSCFRALTFAWKLITKLVAETQPMLLCQGASYPKVVDALLASTSLVACVLTLSVIDMHGALPFQVFAPPMLASAIIFFGGAAPPPPAAFVTGTLGAFALGAVLHQLGATGSMIVQCFAAGLLLLFFKLSGSFFVPTVGLAAFLAQSTYEGHSLWHPLAYLFAPWATGHFLLYCAASMLSVLRQQIRVSIKTKEWKKGLSGVTHGPAREEELRKIFDKYDTSGDGALDASELKLALRFVTGDDLEIEDCERIVRSMDTDGDGVIDFHEFVLALDEHM